MTSAESIKHQAKARRQFTAPGFPSWACSSWRCGRCTRENRIKKNIRKDRKLGLHRELQLCHEASMLLMPFGFLNWFNMTLSGQHEAATVNR